METQRWIMRGGFGAAALVLACSPVKADVVFGDFESGSAPGFGYLTGTAAGIVPWTGPAFGNVITAPPGPLGGSKVLELTGQQSFNFGQTQGAALAFNFLSQGLRNDFLANDQLEFDWYPVNNGAASGFQQLFNIILNSQGGGFTNVDGSSTGNTAAHQNYFNGASWNAHHIVVNYTNYKNAILSSGNTDGGGWLEFGIQPNAGADAPADMYFDNFKLSVAPTIWNADADGTWSTDGNWLPAANPNAAGKVALFGPAITAPHTVTVDAAKTVGQINFNNANKYTIAGTNTLTLDSTSAVGINASAGSHDITAPLALAKDANIVVGASGTTLTLSNLQASPVNITKVGAGKLAVNNVRGNALAVNAGTVGILSNGTSAGTSKVTALTISGATDAWTSALDLSNNSMVVDYTGSSPITTVQNQVKSGFNNGPWTGNGITSSAAAATASSAHKTGIGIMEASDTGTTSFGGQTVDANSVLLKHTYFGDANLDGTVNTTDFNLLAGNFGGSGKRWFNGDFNYDGSVNTTDFNLLASNFGQTLAAGSSSLGAVVPEPTSLALIGLGCGLLATRRRRQA